jgi:hypothetical protein
MLDGPAAEQKVLDAMGGAMGRFSMLRRRDRVAVAVSGGKDSLTLLHALVAYKKRAPFPYDLIALTLEQGKFKLPILVGLTAIPLPGCLPRCFRSGLFL